MMVFVMTMVVGSLILTSVSVQRGLQEASARSGHLFHSIDWIIEALRLPLTAAAAFCAAASAVLTLLWSHRFAGPLRVINEAMSKISQGDLTSPLKIRRWDALRSTAEDLLIMQESLKSLHKSERDKALELSSRMVSLSKSLPENHSSRSELQQLAHDVKDLGSRYQI